MNQPATLHGWVYVQNSPIIYVDPTGHQPAPPSSCPCPPTGKYWKYVAEYRLTAYGHAVHEKFVEQRGGPFVPLEWNSTEGVKYTTQVSSVWLENIRPETGEGTAGKLEGTGKGTVFIKCSPEKDCAPGKLPCNEYTEEHAKTGAAGTRLRPYRDGAINPVHNKDLALGDVVCIAGGAGVITIRDHGTGQAAWDSYKRGTWIDIYVGEHGWHDWDKTILGKHDVWVLRSLLYPVPCDWNKPSICPR